MKFNLIIWCLCILFINKSFALELDSDIDFQEPLIAANFPYKELPSNGCPSQGEFGKGHFGNGADAISTCPGSSNPTLGYG